MSANYEDILDTQWAEVPEHGLVPSGTYVVRVLKAELKSTEKGSRISIMHSIESAVDVDEDALEGVDLTDADPIFTTVFLNGNRGKRQFRDLATKHGIEVDGTLKDTLEALKNTKAVAFIDIGTFQRNDGQSAQQNQAKNFVAIED